MLKLSKKSEYAFMAAKYMAMKSKGSYVTAKEISDNFSISFELVAKVLQKMVKNNLIMSYQGAKGGYVLKKNPFEITLMDLVKAVESKHNITECISNDPTIKECSHINCCKIRNPLIEIQRKIDLVFEETKLSQIL